MTPTAEQEAIIQVARTPDSLMVTAFAGCAKTSTLEMAGRQVKVPALALAFNKKIATEMASRFEGNFSVKTLNSLGHAAWGRAIGVAKITLDDRKLGKLVTEVAKDRKVDLDSEQWDQLRRLVSAAMQAGIVPRECGEGLLPDDTQAWHDGPAEGIGLLDDDFEFLHDLAREVLVKNIELAKQGTISFDDQVYCSTMLGGRFPQFPVVFLDEAQDLSVLNHLMVSKCLRPDGKMLVVGDPKQAIYAFRNAHTESMGQIRALRPQWQDLPLATTFRCPKVVVARQQFHVPGFTAWHTNPDGRYARLGLGMDNKYEAGWDWEHLQNILPNPGVAIAMLCRNNGPLLAMAFRLLAKGIGVQMLGTDIGKGLVALARKISPEDGTPIDIVRGLVDDWERGEADLARVNRREEKLAGISDRAECLRAVISGGQVRDAGQLRNAITRLFARKEGLVTLASIHRAKGLEWDVVVHLDPWRIPSKWAKKAAAASGDSRQLEQEWNLAYVAETRTKHTLINADVESFA